MSLSLAPLSLPALILQLRPLPSAVVTRFTVLWADPTPATARPFPRGRPVEHALTMAGLPCCVVFLANVPSPLPRRTRRGGLFGAFDGPWSRRQRPSLSVREVGIRIVLFRGLSGVHFVTAHLLAESPDCDPDSSKASADSLPPRLFRLLPGGTNNLPDGTCTRWKTTPLHGAADVPEFPCGCGLLCS